MIAPRLTPLEDQLEVSIDLANVTFCIRDDHTLDRPRQTAPSYEGWFECPIGSRSPILWFYISVGQIDLRSHDKCHHHIAAPRHTVLELGGFEARLRGIARESGYSFDMSRSYSRSVPLIARTSC
jgi:hypothetical protein